ncbi:hypothetical protein GJA_4251 [Janthinobacterium agaricidamnosum NBRC 102515 = DSM 9628]|uniref:Uncharacterized protein n=1 Tax=Janthinobacterium agaricidamnosum NBRC 102515 = DSM 9628 TaxID=1349767 RepID=W0VAF1_9BURK|nr:hypothetical protein GJA_4251 [Janthinobacterium agaricidamnosum NBRC 102515 = DSM 9628]
MTYVIILELFFRVARFFADFLMAPDAIKNFAADTPLLIFLFK